MDSNNNTDSNINNNVISSRILVLNPASCLCQIMTVLTLTNETAIELLYLPIRLETSKATREAKKQREHNEKLSKLQLLQPNGEAAITLETLPII